MRFRFAATSSLCRTLYVPHTYVYTLCVWLTSSVIKFSVIAHVLDIRFLLVFVNSPRFGITKVQLTSSYAPFRDSLCGRGRLD